MELDPISIRIFKVVGCALLFIGALWIPKRSRQWVVGYFKELDFLADYFPLLFTRWQAALWGGSVLAVAFGWHFITADWPYPVKVSACVTALFFAGYYVWRADHVRLKRKLSIKALRINEWQVSGHRAKGYYFGLHNESEGDTLEEVSVQLIEMQPPVAHFHWLPVNLHLQHDNPVKPEDQIKKFNLNPGELRNVDFVSAKEGDNRFSVVHVVAHVTYEVPYDSEGSRLQVKVTAKGMPSILIWFKVWRDVDGALQCERE
jgi:hypothetical protein